MPSKSNLMIKKKTWLLLAALLLGALFLSQATPGKADQSPADADQLVFPLHYEGEGISTESELDHHIHGDTICPSTATWEITLVSNGRLHGSYLNTDPKAANNGECKSVYDEDHPSKGINRIDFSGIHSDGHFEITESNLYYDYTNWQFRGHDKNIQGSYDADHIYTSPNYRYEDNFWSNWTDVFEHEFDLPEVGGARSADDSGQDAVTGDDTGQDGVTTGDIGQDEVVGDDTGQEGGTADNSSGMNPWVPVIGIGAAGAVGAAAAAGAAAVAVSRGRTGGRKTTDGKTDENMDEEQDEKKEDPCSDDLNRLKEASAQARALHDGIQTLRNHLKLLETQYENVRQAGYWNASVDLALLGASIFGAPATIGLTGKAAAQKTIDIAMRDSALTALGGELMKSVTNGMLNQGVSWESLLKAPYGGAESVVLQNVITECLTQRYGTRLAQQGYTRTVRNALMKGYSGKVASHIASGVMQFISVGKIVYGAYQEVEKLEAIREIMGDVRQSLFEMELLYEDALSEMRISRSVYEKCRQMWQL